MKVLHVTRDFPPATKGGISTAVGGMVEALIYSGIKCGVVSFDGWRPAAECRPGAGESTELTAGSNWLQRVHYTSDLASAHVFAQSFNPDIIHVHHGLLWDFVAALLVGRRLPVLKTVHVIQKEMNRLRGVELPTLSLRGQEEALNNSDHVMAPSNEAARILLEYYPFLEDRLTVMGLGIHDVKTDPTTDSTAKAAHKTIISVGRFDQVKGTDELIRIARVLLERRADANFVVAGGIPANRRGEAKWLDSFRKGIPGDVYKRFQYAGWLSDVDLKKLYTDASVFVSTSRFETFGIAVLEAMLHGLPVAAVRCGGISELVDHGQTGLLSEPEDTEGLANNILSLFDNQEAALGLGRAAATAVRNGRLWSQVVGELIGVYERLLRGL